MIYSYIVNKKHLNDQQLECLNGQDEIISVFSPRELGKYFCADFQFPNGDSFSLDPVAVYLDTAEAIN
jgi:hypothetical protein